MEAEVQGSPASTAPEPTITPAAAGPSENSTNTGAVCSSSTRLTGSTTAPAPVTEVSCRARTSPACGKLSFASTSGSAASAITVSSPSAEDAHAHSAKLRADVATVVVTGKSSDGGGWAGTGTSHATTPSSATSTRPSRRFIAATTARRPAAATPRCRPPKPASEDAHSRRRRPLRSRRPPRWPNLPATSPGPSAGPRFRRRTLGFPRERAPDSRARPNSRESHHRQRPGAAPPRSSRP